MGWRPASEGGSGHKHRAYISALLAQNPKYKTKGFFKALTADILKPLDVEDYQRLPRFTPDLFRIYTAEETGWKPVVHIIEVEDTHSIGRSEDKLERVWALWFVLDCESIDLVLTTLDATFGVFAVPDMSLVYCGSFPSPDEPDATLKKAYHATPPKKGLSEGTPVFSLKYNDDSVLVLDISGQPPVEAPRIAP